MPKSKHFKRNIASIILSIFIAIFLSTSVLLTAASVLINPNTAAHMWFDVDLDDTMWTAKSDYKWDNTVLIDQELVRSDWVDSMAEISIDYYSTDSVLMWFAEALSKDINAETTATEQFDNTIYDVIESKEMKQYVDDFLRQQAGYLLGENPLPIPSHSDLDSILSIAVTDIGGEHIQTWYTENKASVIESMCAGLIATNDNFSVTMLNENKAFSEACLVFKVLNLSIATYVILVLAIVLSAIIFFIQDKLRFSLFMMCNQIGSLLFSILYTIGIGDVSFIVLGNAFAPTDIMIAETQTSMIYVMIVFVIATVTFGLFAVHFKWNFYGLAHRTSAFCRKIFHKKTNDSDAKHI